MSADSHQCFLYYLHVFQFFKCDFVTWKQVSAKPNYHITFHLRAGREECPYSQYFPYPFLFCQFQRFCAADEAQPNQCSVLSLICRAHNGWEEAADCCCAGFCNLECRIWEHQRNLIRLSLQGSKQNPKCKSRSQQFCISACFQKELLTCLWYSIVSVQHLLYSSISFPLLMNSLKSSSSSSMRILISLWGFSLEEYRECFCFNRQAEA